jgi:hypothetical protein
VERLSVTRRELALDDRLARLATKEHRVTTLASDHTEMPKRLFDGLTLFGRARLDVTITPGALRPTQRRYAVNFFDMDDPPRLRNEAVVTLHELLNFDVRGHFLPPPVVPSCVSNSG